MRRITTRTARLLVMALVVGGTVNAQSPLQQRISVTYQGATAPSVFHARAEVLGFRLQLDGRVTGAVVLDVRRVSVETVLRAVCESIGCRWRVEKDTLVVDPDAGAVKGVLIRTSRSRSGILPSSATCATVQYRIERTAPPP